MRISQIQVVNFRCLREFRMSLDDVTVLVGANSTGKSTALHALAWFFDGGALAIEDVSGHQPNAQVSVGVTFRDFDVADRDALGSYVLADEATFWRTWSPDGGEKLTGKGRAYGAFAAVREHGAAMPKRNAYQELRAAQPELGLPAAGSAAAVDAALAGWEAEHPEALTEARTDATHLFGFTGQARMAHRMDFVLVPAVSDPDAETQDARGTLLRQLLDRALGEQSEMRARLSALEGRISREMHEIMAEEGGAALDRLSIDVTGQLSQLVPGSEVALSTRAPSVKVPGVDVELRVADEGLETAVGRQGHGFQRALLIAVVQQLAELTARTDAESGGASEDGEEDAPSPPALFLALEEPELYQHPLQARHFAATLAGLTGQTGAPVQVAYATHSEHFVDPANYERLRRFRRRADAAWPESEVTQALVARVAARLADVQPPEQIALRVQLTLRRQVAEAVFAKAVLVVEGESDAGLLHGVADRAGGLDALGISVVRGQGKHQLLIPWAILAELGVPSYVVFDGDAGLAERMLRDGRTAEAAEQAQQEARARNELMLTALGAEPDGQPPTRVTSEFAVFADTLEAEAEVWEGFAAAVSAAKNESGDFRGKSGDAYRRAAATATAAPPPVFAEILARVNQLAV